MYFSPASDKLNFFTGESNIIDRDLSRKQHFEVKCLDDRLVYYKHATFSFTRCYVMDWNCDVDYCDAFLQTATIHCRGSTGKQVIKC